MNKMKVCPDCGTAVVSLARKCRKSACNFGAFESLPGPDPVSAPVPTDLIQGMDKQRFFAVVVAFAGGLAVFLPWFHVPVLGSISGLQTDWGWILSCLFGVSVIVCALGDKRYPMEFPQRAAVFLPGILAALCALFEMFELKSNVEANAAENVGNIFIQAMVIQTYPMAGIYVVIAAGIVLFFMCNVKTQKVA